jgi:PEP-CTERM motif
MHRLLLTFGLLSALAIPAAADTFNYSATGASGPFSGAGTFTATPTGSGSYLITAITGTGVTGLYAPGDFNLNDNLLYPAALPTLDSHGFSFVDVNGPDTYAVNIFSSGSGYLAYLQDEDNFTQIVPVTFSLSVATPEPSSLVLLGTGVLCILVVGRRKYLHA